MSIDTGQSLVFNANFPTPGVEQPSQQFRDNFAIIQTAIEHLQKAGSELSLPALANNATSVLEIHTSVDPTNAGAVLTKAVYKNNALILPLSSISTTSPSTGFASAGMVRFDQTSGVMQFFDGGNWNPVVFKDTNGLVTLSTLTVTDTLTIGYTPTANTDAVSLKYVKDAFNSANASLASQSFASNAAVTAVQNDLNAEKTNRINGDTNLQTQITSLNGLVANASSTVSGISGQLTALSSGLSSEANSRIAADTTLTSQVNDLNDRVSNAENLAGSVTADIVQEGVDRAAADQVLNDLINAVVANTVTINSADIESALGYVPANKAGDNFTGTVTVLAANSVTSADYFVAEPTDIGVGKPGFYITKRETADLWEMNLFQGNSGYGGTLSVNLTTFNVNGDITSNGSITASGDISGLSDASIKYDVRQIENALDKVDAIRGVLFKRNDIEGNPEQMGVIAQEVQAVAPQVVHEQPSGLLAVSYGNLTALLIEAIKELRAEVNEIKKKL